VPPSEGCQRTPCRHPAKMSLDSAIMNAEFPIVGPRDCVAIFPEFRFPDLGPVIIPVAGFIGASHFAVVAGVAYSRRDKF